MTPPPSGPGEPPSSPVRVERLGAVLVVHLARPAARNAIDAATAEALLAAFLAFEADPEAAVAILTGDGGTFSAGADLKAIAGGRPNRLEAVGADPAAAPGPLGPTRLTLSKPVIAAIEGHAVAGGLELALWCDLRVMAADAVLGVFCRRFGVPLIDGGTVRLPRLIGLSRALDLILTGRPVGAEEAEHLGLANRVVPPGQALAAARRLAEDLAGFPQACLRADLASARQAFEGDLQTALAREFAPAVALVQAEGEAGARRFADGAGRGGRFPAAAPTRPPSPHAEEPR